MVGIATSNGKLTLNGSDLIYEGKDGTNAIGEFDEKTGSVTIEGITINGEKLPTIPEGFEIGTVVSYAPNGTYNWQAKYASSDLATDGTADITLASGTSLTEGNTDMSITEWKVFDVNKLTGEIKLVPSKPNTNKVRLQGANGYNNAVKLLNEACSSLYGKEGVTARSINIEDIESVLQYDPKTWVNDSVNVSYNQQYTEAYTENKIYPAIYAQEKDSVITPAPTGISKTLGRSDSAREWITGTMSAETSIKPYQTYYHVWIKSLLESEYVNVLLPSDWATDYWIASHSIFLGENGCVFSVMGIKDGMMDAFDMIRTGGTEFEGACILFPIVSLNIDQIAGDMENGFNVK